MARKKKSDAELDDLAENNENLSIDEIEEDHNPALQNLPSTNNSTLSTSNKYFDVANPVALFPFISFSGDNRETRIWKRTTVNPIDGSVVEQKLEFIADAGTKKTAQGKPAWLALLGVKYLWERQNKPANGKVSFSMHELCRIFDIPYNGRRNDEFKRAFIALNRMTIASTNALTRIDPETGKRKPVEADSNGAFISMFGRIATGDKGNRVERFYVQINDIYINCLNTQDSSRVNLTMIANLSSSRSISLYVLLCSYYQSFRNEIIDYNLEDLAQDLPLNPARSALSKVKEDLEPIFKELIRNELLKSYTFISTTPQTDASKRPKTSEVIVRFELGQRIVVAPAQIPRLIASNSLLLPASTGEDGMIGRLCKLGYSVNEANYLFKMYTQDQINYALDVVEKASQKRTISSPTNYFKGILEKATPDKYTKAANETRKKNLIQNSNKNVSELYREYYEKSKQNVADHEGIYWEQLVKDEIERLSQDENFKDKSEIEKKRIVEYDLLTSAPYNIYIFEAFKDHYLKGNLPAPYVPLKKGIK